MEKKEDVWQFEKLEQQLHSFLDEMSELSRKKPNDPVNKFKLKFLNTTLDKLNRLLADYRPFEDFQQFDRRRPPQQQRRSPDPGAVHRRSLSLPYRKHRGGRR